jgi:hypothetical protein
VLECPFLRYIPYINKRKIAAFLHIDLGQKTNFLAARPFRGRVREGGVDDTGGTTIFWSKKSGAPGLVDAYCPLIIAYTTYIKLNWRPFLGAASHFSGNSNHFPVAHPNPCIREVSMSGTRLNFPLWSYPDNPSTFISSRPQAG